MAHEDGKLFKYITIEQRFESRIVKVVGGNGLNSARILPGDFRDSVVKLMFDDCGDGCAVIVLGLYDIADKEGKIQLRENYLVGQAVEGSVVYVTGGDDILWVVVREEDEWLFRKLDSKEKEQLLNQYAERLLFRIQTACKFEHIDVLFSFGASLNELPVGDVGYFWKHASS